MAEIPHSPDTSPPAETAVTREPTVNGTPPQPPPPPAPRPTLQEWAKYRLAQAAALFALWVVVFLAATYFGFNAFNGSILAAILTVVLSFFLRPLLPIVSPADKHKPAPGTDAAAQDAPQRESDPVREIIETIVFVVVLVLMLKTFVAEAFVIPTGSMAETLYGYQKLVTCPKCGYVFPVNCSYEVDGESAERGYVSGCTCPNCRRQIRLVPPVNGYMNVRIDPAKLASDGMTVDPAKLETDKDKDKGIDEVLDGAVPAIGGPRVGWHSGDRVLVSKFVYDLPGGLPNRMDVVVFRFPGDASFPRDSGPIKNHSPMNYIKRLIGKPGETIALCRGKIYVLSPEKAKEVGLIYDDYEKAKGDPDKLSQLWRPKHYHHNDKQALDLFEQANSPFEIYRKPAAQVKAMMRLVFDCDYQPKDLDGLARKRWRAGDGWADAGETSFKHEGESEGRLTYQHLLRGNGDKPSLITDFVGYNTFEGGPHRGHPGENWVSDLVVECSVDVKKASGTFALELSKGPFRYQASFDLATGQCTLYRVEGKTKEALKGGEAATKLKGTGTHAVRFANVDDRLIVWVDGKLSFGQGIEYAGVRKLVPTQANDLDSPASIVTKGDVTVSQLRIFRDTYYTLTAGEPDVRRLMRDNGEDAVQFDPTDAKTFKAWEQAGVATYFVQPDHFLCLGDNSPESSDGRTWGLVPRRLLLGRALLVYYPFERAGRIR